MKEKINEKREKTKKFIENNNNIQQNPKEGKPRKQREVKKIGEE